jgi:DNA-binding MarR family transcriptional regulator
MSPAPSTPLRAPRGCTNFKTRQMSRLLSRHYDAELANAGLKTTQYSLLGHVLHLGPEASTLTRNLHPLVAAGWLVQDAGTDARSRSVHITDAGRIKHAEAQRCWKRAQTAINELLGPDRVLALHTLLDDCTALLDDAGGA